MTILKPNTKKYCINFKNKIIYQYYFKRNTKIGIQNEEDSIVAKGYKIKYQ